MFDVEFVVMVYLIFEFCVLVIWIFVGLVLYIGDWKIDFMLGVGFLIDMDWLVEFGWEGVMVLVCDSINVVCDGVSFSEVDVVEELKKVMVGVKYWIVVMIFVLNVVWIWVIVEVVVVNDWDVVVVGWLMYWVIEVFSELGYFDGLFVFYDEEVYGYFLWEKIVFLCIGL